MPLSINTNIASLTAQRAMVNSNAGLERSFERLSTGQRINSASDDAAGLAIGKDLESRVSGLNQAIRNANDAISMVQIAEGSLDEATSILQRMRDLSVQAANGSLSSVEQGYLDAEHTKLAATLDKVIAQASFNNQTLLSTSDKTSTFQVGADRVDTLDVTFDRIGANILGVDASQIALNATGTKETASFTNFAQSARMGAADYDTVSLTTGFAAGDTISVKYGEAAATNIVLTAGTAADDAFIADDTNLTKFVAVLNDRISDASFAVSNTDHITVTLGAATLNSGTDGDKATNFTLGATTAGNGNVARASVTAFTQNGILATDTFKLTVGSTEFTTAAGAYATNTAIAAALDTAVGDSAAFDVGVNGSDEITVTYKIEGNEAETTYKLEKTLGHVGTDSTTTGHRSIVDGVDDAATAIVDIDAALAEVAKDRAALGATQQQLESTVRNLANVAENTSAAQSRIMDTDYAAETANLTKAQILQQAATSILAQANAQPQAVLSLLQ